MRKILLYFLSLFSMIVVVVTVYYVIEISDGFKKSDAFLVVIEAIRENQEVDIGFNSELKISNLVSGRLNDEEAYFKFHIYSEEKKFVVYSNLVKNKDSGLWEVISLDIEGE